MVGATLGLTGSLSFYDLPFLAGAELAIKDINEKGGVGGRKLEIITNDNATEPSEIVPKAEEMIAKHPALLLTSVSDTTGLPAAQAAQKAGQLVMSQVGPTTFGSQVGPLVFNVYNGDPSEAAVMAQFAGEEGFKKVILAEDQAIGYTKDICNLYREAFEKVSPGGVLGTVKFNSLTETTFPSQASEIKAASEAQAVVICGIATTAPTLIKQIRAAGVTVPLIGMGGGLDGTYWMGAISNLGKWYSNSAGASDPDGGSVYKNNPNPEQQRLIAEFTKETGERPDGSVVYSGYTAIQLLADAVEKSGGSTDSEVLAETLNKFEDVQTMLGKTTYSPECHVPTGRNWAVTTVVDQGGKLEGRYLKTLEADPSIEPQVPC